MTSLLLCVLLQQSHQEHDVVRSPGDQRAGAEDLQEPGAAGSAGGEPHKQTVGPGKGFNAKQSAGSCICAPF